MLSLLRLVKKNSCLIEIIIVLTIIDIFDHNMPEQIQLIKTSIQAFFDSLFPNNIYALGYKIISITIGVFVLLLFQKKYIYRVFFPLHFFRELLLALCVGIIMFIPVILGLITGILKGTNISLNTMTAILTFAVINAFAEEIIYRAYPLMRASNNPPFTFNQIITNKYLWVSALFFGFVHFDEFGLWALTAIISGFIFGLLYLYRGNIWPSFFAHTGMVLSTNLVNNMNISLHFIIMSIALPCTCIFVWWVTFGTKNKKSINDNRTKGITNLLVKDTSPGA